MKSKSQPAIAYYRVSTVRQGQSGLGLEAQKASVESFCRAHGYQVVGEYQDVESGKHDARPALRAALAEAKAKDATVIIAKLDRLSRNASFIMALKDSGVRFIAADMPEANELTVGILAVVAQAERTAISERTKAALQAVKARGRTLGTPANLTDAARVKAAEAKRRAARLYANGAITHAVNYRAAGWTLRAIADTLNESGARTRHGHPYTPTTVRRLLMMADHEKTA
jgi:DNA invertase Pin-like site-specific DNA recombinase